MGVGQRVSSGKPYLSMLNPNPRSSPSDAPDGTNETGPPGDAAEADVRNEPSNETRPSEGLAAAAVAEVVVARRREEETKTGDELVVSIHCFVSIIRINLHSVFVCCSQRQRSLIRRQLLRSVLRSFSRDWICIRHSTSLLSRKRTYAGNPLLSKRVVFIRSTSSFLN